MEIKWKKTLLISFGILFLIIGGVVTYAKMTNQNVLDLLPQTLKGMILGAGGNLTKEDYYSKINNNKDGIWTYTLKNPDSKNLSFDDLINETNKLGDETLNKSHVFSVYDTFEIEESVWQNVSVPNYINIVSGTRIIDVINLTDFNKTHLSHDERTGNGFIEKDRLVNYSVLDNTITLNKTVQQQNGTKLELQKVHLTQEFRIEPNQEVTFERKITPKMSKLPDGSFGWSVFQDWWNVSFDKRINITLNNTASLSNFTDFTVLVILNSSRIDYADILDAGEDIRFTDDDESTILSHEIELWNETGDSFVWVKVPLLENTTTDFIQMYYNNQSVVTDGQDVPGTWDNSYVLVNHFAETSGTDIADSTTPNSDGVAQGSPVLDTPGFIGSGIQNSASSQLVNYSSPTEFDNIDNGTIFSWVNLDNLHGDEQTILTKEVDITGSSNFGAEPGFIFWTRQQGSNELLRLLKKRDTTSLIVSTVDLNITTGIDYAFATSWDLAGGDTDQKIYYGNDSIAFTETNYASQVGGSGGGLDDSASIMLSMVLEIGFGELDGTVDEIRLSNVSRSEDWLEAEFLTTGKNDIFTTYGSQETLSADDPPKWFDNSTNSTTAGEFILHSVNWTDDTALSGYVFSFCNGTYATGGGGDTQINWSDSHITGTFSDPNNALGPSDGTWTTDANGDSPDSRYAMENITGSIAGTQNITVLVRPEDAGANGDPTIVVELFEDGSSVRNIVNSTTVLNTAGDINISGTFDASEITEPDDVEIRVIVTSAGGGPNANTLQMDSIRWNVSDGAGGESSCLDASPTFTNDTFVTMSGTQDWSNVSKIVNATVGSTIKWIVYANDSTNQFNVTDTFAYNTTAGVADSCTYTSGDWEVTCSDECNITSNVVGDGSNLILSGSGNFNIEANITGFQEVHKDNACFAIKSNDAQIELTN